jgi:hypothetical protein
MEPNEYPSDPPVVALPGICARVHLPRPPNFLRAVSGGTVAIGDLYPDDLTRLAFAMARQLRAHWHERMTKRQRLSPAESGYIGADLIPDGVARGIAKTLADRGGVDWWGLGHDGQEKAGDDVAEVLTLFLEELNRA